MARSASAGRLICASPTARRGATGDELFGTERVASVLQQYADQSPGDLAEALVADVRRFHGDDLVDDLALLLLRADLAVRERSSTSVSIPSGRP